MAASTVPEPPERGTAAYIAEFIGTTALVFFVTMAVSLYIEQAPQGLPQPFIDWSVIGLVHVFVLFMLIQTLALVCGAHFNPAVTAALTVIRQIKPIDAAIYIVVQFAGAHARRADDEGLPLGRGQPGELRRGGDLAATRRRVFWGGVGLEAIGTFFLMWAIVGVAVNPRAERGWAALVIGGTLGMAVFVIGPLTGAGLNPARAFGPALVSGEWGGFDDFVFTYVLAPVVGAVLAVLVYFRLAIVPGEKEPGPMEPVG